MVISPVIKRCIASTRMAKHRANRNTELTNAPRTSALTQPYVFFGDRIFDICAKYPTNSHPAKTIAVLGTRAAPAFAGKQSLQGLQGSATTKITFIRPTTEKCKGQGKTLAYKNPAGAAGSLKTNEYERCYWTRKAPACLLTLLCHYGKPRLCINIHHYAPPI